MQLVDRADDQRLGLVWIELQTVLHVPLPNASSTCGNNGETRDCVVGAHR